MRKINNILVILFIVILSLPNIGICGKIEFESDAIQKRLDEYKKEKRSVIGNTYSMVIRSDRVQSFPLKFCLEKTSEINCASDKKIIIKENMDLIVLDLVDSLYKVILDPNGDKITAYIETYEFSILTEGPYGHKLILKSEISDEDRQKLISENEKNRINKKQQEKKIAQQKKKERQKKIAKKEAKKETNSKESCYQFNYRYGRCGTMAVKGYQCDPADDIVVPVECRNTPESDRGLRDGVKSVY